MLGQTMGGEPMSTPESAFRVHHLVFYKASEEIFLSSIPKLSSPPSLQDISALFSIFSQSVFFVVMLLLFSYITEKNAMLLYTLALFCKL